jgi:hypothetical protein
MLPCSLRTQVVVFLERSAAMASIQQRHDDVVIQRRFGEDGATHVVKQVYAVTYPDHTDRGTERETYGEAERAALKLAEERGLSVWFEETPQSGRRTLVKSFRP